MTKKIIYLDCFSGISGDMFLGALIDSGLSLNVLEEYLSSLAVGGYRLEAEKVCRKGITGTAFRVVVEREQSFRNIVSIEKLIDKSGLPTIVKDKTMKIFRKLALVEGQIHGMKPEEVHFHEIGALDSIVDITGVVSALHILKVDELISSPLPLGRGFINIAHGKIPLPAPATVALLADAEAPVYGTEISGELVTPTGAVLINVLASGFGDIPAFSVERVGYGAGKKDFQLPNFLRIFTGKAEKQLSGHSEKVDLIEANIDDMSGEISGYVMDKLFAKGALDVYFTAVQMKKNRPGVKITVLSAADKTALLKDIILRETTTLGCRIWEASKIMLPRRFEEVETPWGKVAVKIVEDFDSEGNLLFTKFSPEYEDCLAIAHDNCLPLSKVFQTVERIFAHNNNGEKA